MTQFFMDGTHLAWPMVYTLIFITLLLLATDLVWRISKLRGKFLLPAALSIGSAGVFIIFKFV